MTANEFKYWAFLGYSHLDNCPERPGSPGVGRLCWGDWLRGALRTFSIPAEFTGQINARGEIIPERIDSIIQDDEERPDNAILSASTRAALEQSRYLVVICSPRSAKSLHVNAAVSYFKHLGRGNRVLPIVVAGEPNASDGDKPGISPDDECFVPAMRHPVKPDGTLDTTRRERGYIFADARQGAEKREILANDLRNAETELEIAKIQLVAGLIGVGFNASLRREQKRRFAGFADAQRQARDAQKQVQEARDQTDRAQNQVQRLENEAREAQSQVEHARSQARDAQNKVLEAQNLAREAQQQIQKIQDQTRDAQSQIQAARSQARHAEDQIREVQNKVGAAQRLTKIFAFLAVLALLAASLVASIAWWQRKAAGPSPTKLPSAEFSKPELALETLDDGQIREALQKIGGAGQEANQQRSLNELAARITSAQIPDALKASSIILEDRQRCHFQKELFVRLGEVNPLSAMTNAGSIEGKIVNDEGLGDSPIYFQLAVLEKWQKTDLPGALDWVSRLPAGVFRQRALERIIPALAANDPQRALAWLNHLTPEPGDRIYTLLFRGWAAKDPVQAIHQRQQVPDHDASNEILCAVMAAWLDQQPDAALNWLKSQPDSDSRNEAFEACVWEQAKSDFSKALALADSLPEGTWRDTIIAGLFDTWATADLEAATAACQQLPEGPAKEQAWEHVLNRRLVKAPASAAGYVKNLAPGDFRQSAIAELCRHWADTDAPAALAWAHSLPSDVERSTVLEQVVSRWAHNDPPAALQFTDQHAGLSVNVFGEIADAWSQSDLAAATNWIASLPTGPRKEAALLAVARSTADHAPALAANYCALLGPSQPAKEVVQLVASSLAGESVSNAVAWARSLNNESLQQAALSALSSSWAQYDPKGLAAYALGLPPGDTQTQYLTAACRQLAVRDLPATATLLQSLADAALRQQILEQAGRVCDLLHLDEAAKFVAAIPAGDDQQAILQGLLSKWAPANPESALNWLCSFPQNNLQTNQIQSVLKAWSQSEPAAASDWLAKLPAGTATDGLISAFLEGAVAKYPEFAGQWTQSVADEAQRQKLQTQVARQWLKTDLSAATNWINHLDLPADIKQSLTAPSP